MFTNLLGRGFLKKFSNIFWKNNVGGVGTIDIEKTNCINGVKNVSVAIGKRVSAKSAIKSEETLLIKKFNSNKNNQTKEGTKFIDNFSGYWDENDRKNEGVLGFEKSKLSVYPSSYNHLISDFRNQMKTIHLDEREIGYVGSLSDNLNSKEVGISFFSNDSELIPNRLKNRVCHVSIRANHVREDRSNAIHLENFNGYFLSVLDGHGGVEVADYASKKLHQKFDNIYGQLKVEENTITEQERVKKAIELAFEEIVKF